ncbi:hypothetical protein NM208_g2603 [Fusarium decemcellulare]|uniref:Uncharacterized protein n=2 Tax=Fusarium decemcellulare TaxID=57161 RepID=A0ACC1SRU0_9HYPO|nr:hypothetical protein NM208_g7835 [Fusarium decemcellulare]KAJ3545233.1 hypothetical protein NM208_g2603 [Fusarium decemcellulare]
MAGDHGYQQVHDAESESPGTKRSAYARYKIYSFDEWGLEMLTLGGSLILFLLIVGIFVWIDQKPRSDWKFFISLNSVASALTTACSAAMMHSVSESIAQLKWLHFKKRPQKLVDFEKFDEASRGPWGSIKFIFGKNWNLAILGAFITIARLFFAPLTQEVVAYPERTVNVSDSSVTFGYAHEYNRNLSGSMFNHWMSSMPHDAQMQSAIFQGLYNISSFQKFSCPGACKWDESYISLGFKTTCENVTVATLRSEKCERQICNMTTPGGIHLSTHHVDTDLQTTFRLNASSTMDDETAQEMPENFPDLVNFAVYRATSDGNFTATNINVTECALSLTAYEYSDGQANGDDFHFGRKEEISLPHKRWNIDVGSEKFKSTLWVNASKSEGLPKLSIGWADIKALQFFFQSEMISTEWIDGSYKNKNPGISAALTGDVDLPARFEIMATSMTDYLRVGPNHKIAKGKRIDKETYVSIRWYWLAGPALIELAAWAFAIATMVSNRKSRNVPLWKSSALAVLACRHERRVGDEVDWIRSDVKDIREIEKTAENTSAKLE